MNKQRVLARIIPALLACTASGYAAASGFQLWEQNGSGVGNSYAGSAAVAENAGTVYFNPAGMTQLQGRNLSVGVAMVDTSYVFHNGASASTGVLTGDNKDGGATGYIPNFNYSMPIAKDLYFGLGIGAPFGLKTDYGSSWMGSAQSISFEVKTINVNPSLAYKLNDTVSLGFGVDWQKLNAKYKRNVGTVNAPGVSDTAGLTALLDVSDDTWGWNAGILLNLSPATKVGISYRSAMKYTATGNIALSNADGSATATGTLAGLNAAGGSSNVAASIKLPDTWIFSATQKLNDQWEMLGDLSWTGWSSIPKIDIVRTSGAASGAIAQTLVTDFRDTWRAALGANYKYSDTTKLKFGIAYDQTPVKGAATRMVSLPDNNRWWLSFGAQWQPTKTSAVDVGVTRLFVKDAQINNDQRTVSAIPAQNAILQHGLINGSYSDKAWVLGAQYSVSF
ncbi:MAG TPA: outer membrane protein transport protein [Rhodocyclaceae bacterium]